jgi:hypothetical protein
MSQGSLDTNNDSAGAASTPLVTVFVDATEAAATGGSPISSHMRWPSECS